MDERYAERQEPFATWLLRQDASQKWFAPLAKAARADRAFPRHGDAEAVRRHMSMGGADPEVFEMLDDAELDWAAL